MLDTIGDVVSHSITLPFKLTIQGAKWICSGIADVTEGIKENSATNSQTDNKQN